MKLIRNWDELKEIPQESDTHILIIDKWSGWIKAKKPSGNWCDDNHYLSTHTFYGGNYKISSKILQKCGFNVVLDNWDN